jgi:hypothetical protein
MPTYYVDGLKDDRSYPAIFIAASDAHKRQKQLADFLCDGVDDQEEFNAALGVLPSEGGKIVLSEGTFALSAAVDLTGHDATQIEGSGLATLITLDDTNPVITTGGSSGASDCLITNLQTDDGDMSIYYANGNAAMYQSTGSGWVTEGEPYIVGLHDILSSYHGDVAAHAVDTGWMIAGCAGTPAWTGFAGNITTTKKFLSQTGNSTVSAMPGWNTIVAGDVPDVSATYVPQTIFNAVGATGYASGTNTAHTLAPNTSATKKFLSQTGTGTAGAAPVWATIAEGDMPAVATDYYVQVRTFTEATQAGTGTYSATVVVPAAGDILDVRWSNQVLWTDTGTAVLTVGDGGDADGFFINVNVKAAPVADIAGAGGVSSFLSQTGSGAYKGLTKHCAAETTVTASIAVQNGDGTAGRSRLTVIYAIPAVVAASFA